jgi:hypothetical protein
MIGVLIRREDKAIERLPCEDPKTEKEDGHDRIEVQMGVTCLQVIDNLGLPEAGRGKGGSSPNGSRESDPLNALILKSCPPEL